MVHQQTLARLAALVSKQDVHTGGDANRKYNLSDHVVDTTSPE
jgi:hypothetical protein